MSRRAQIEEIDDDGALTSNASRFEEIDEFDDDTEFELPDEPAITPQARLQPERFKDGPAQTRDGLNPQGIRFVNDDTQFKKWNCLYPIYFDASRTTKHGRKLSKELCVNNPLAKAIADSCKVIGFSCVLELHKSHPADWANPGRVRVLFKENGKLQHPAIKTKHALYLAIAKYLRDHPTKAEDVLKVPVDGLPSDKVPAKAAIPKGMNINAILPLHSPAMSGGGINSDMFKGMLGGGLDSMMSSLDAAAPAPVEQKAAVPPKKPKMKRQIIR
jgi:signal recognition particle subunit SRP19